MLAELVSFDGAWAEDAASVDGAFARSNDLQRLDCNLQQESSSIYIYISETSLAP
jgi:hypothetical protein